MTSTTTIVDALGLTAGGPPPSKDPEQSWSFWQYYQCVKSPGTHWSLGGYVCSKTRVPFFERVEHRYHVKAPSILPDNLQRMWIWQSHPDVSFWPPGTR